MNEAKINDDKSKIEMLQLVSQFRNRQKAHFTQQNIDEFRNKEKIAMEINVNGLRDAIFQVKMDEAMAKILPEALEIIAKNLVWVSFFSNKAKQEEYRKNQQNIVAEIVKLLERENVEYFYAEHIVAQFEQMIASIFKQSQEVIKQRYIKVFEGLANDKFDCENMTMGHVAKYSEENFDKEK